MIICYHKTRKKFYVVRNKTKDGRKFLHYSPSYDECADWILRQGGLPIMSRSAAIALGIDPTRSDASSDASTGVSATNIAVARTRRPTRSDDDGDT